MLLESLIVFSCLEQQGCSKTTSAYYQQNKEFQATVKEVEAYGKRLTNNYEYIVYVATPLYMTAVGKPASFKVYKGTVLKVNFKDRNVAVEWNY